MNILLLLLAVIIIAVIAVAITTMYVKAPPNVAYIISGMGKNPRILIGQGGVKLPFVERLDKLYVGQLSVDIKTGQSVPTNDARHVAIRTAVGSIPASPKMLGLTARM